jgi:hypothetical protein
VFSCRIGGGTTTFELCVMNADGTGLVRLTDNAVPDLTATWSPMASSWCSTVGWLARGCSCLRCTPP